MTLLLRSLLLGYGGAAFGSAWLQDWVGTWAAVLVAWVGGGMLTLAFAGIGAWLRPEPEGALPAGPAERRVSRETGHAGPAGYSPHAMPERHAPVRLTLS